MNWMVRQISEVETQIVSVERVKEYSELKTEVKKTYNAPRYEFLKLIVNIL